jgi:hypothetical protein
MTGCLKQPQSAIEVVAPGAPPNEVTITYSIGTLVRDSAQYEAMRNTFLSSGFSGPDCEYLFVDNMREKQTSAYCGLNSILNAARGIYVILCHQDVRIIADNRAVLDTRLAELHRLDLNWGVAGNAGGISPENLAIRITDPHGENQHVGNLPAKAISLDENFIVVRRDARLGFSNDLSGFHFYGTDICLNADVRGYSAYVIDFHLHHLSGGQLSAEFFESKKAFEAKWTRALRQRSVRTTCCEFCLEGSHSIEM